MSVSDMRNASMHPIKLAVVLLCALAAGTPALAQDAKPAAAPAAAAKGFTPPSQSNNTPIDSIAVIVNDEVITRR